MFIEDNKKMNIVIGLILFSLTILGHFFADANILASLMWPAFGVATIYYFYFDKKVLLGIVIGISLGQFFNELILESNTTFIDVLMRISFVLTSVIEVMMFKLVFLKFRTKNERKVIDFFVFFGSGIVATAIGGLFVSSVLYILFKGDLEFGYNAVRWMLGDFSGLILFGSILYFVLDSKEKFIINYRNFIFHSAFILFSLIIFSEVIQDFNFQDFSYFFIIFFIISAVMFRYSNLFLLAIEFLVGYQMIYIKITLSNYDIDIISIQVRDLNIFLAILIGTSILLKYFYDESKKSLEVINDKNYRLEGILNSVNSFFSIGEQLITENKNLNEEYLKNMFKIATTIYDKYDGASCYIKTDDKVYFIESTDYDIEDLNSNEIDPKTFILDTNKAIHLSSNAKSKNDSFESTSYIFKVPIIKESICIGVQLKEGIIGGITIDLHNDSSKQFEKSDIESLQSIQTYMNTFYKMSSMVSKNMDLKNDIVFSLVRTLELYDQYTGGHSEDVAVMSREVARHIGLDDETIENTFWSGICHDIGKVGVKHSIINKPSKLTEEEYEQVKMHSVYAYNVLKESKDLEHIATIVKHHHEWYNGSGYPDGLVKDEIPFESQILMVADSVSSMVTKRPYNTVKTKEQVLEELNLYSGSQFNPKIVDSMTKLIKNGIFNKYMME